MKLKIFLLLLMLFVFGLMSCRAVSQPISLLTPEAVDVGPKGGSPIPTALPILATNTPKDSLAPMQAVGPSAQLLIVTNAQAQHISLVDPSRGTTKQIEVGIAPWGVALAGDQRLYVSTAEGIAIVDLNRRERVALVPYQSEVGSPEYGEYRPGGMGIAVSSDGRQVYVGVYLSNQPSRLEILDTETFTVVVSTPVGVRPFEVLSNPDGSQIFTIDHDSYSITVVDQGSLETRTLEVAPLGRGAFDKPHYAAMDADGWLWLPFQGQALAHLDPTTGQFSTFPLSADTHQHGVALTQDGRYLLIVGTGPAGEASAGPSLTIFDTQTKEEKIVPLPQTHEDIAVSPDGRWAYLTGGNSLSGGWDGLTVVDLQSETFTEVAVPDAPLDILVVSMITTPQVTEIEKGRNMEELNRLLIAAARRGEVATVQDLLAQGASVEASDERGVTALIAAAYQNQVDVAKILIEAGANVNVQDNTQQSAYLIPTADGYLELLELTLQAGADVHSLDSYNGTGLIRAADRGHVEIIQTLLKTDIDVDHINRLGWTALLEAIILGDGGPRHTEVVRLLVQAGADVNLADSGGVTPLAHAYQRDYQGIISILEEAGGKR